MIRACKHSGFRWVHSRARVPTFDHARRRSVCLAAQPIGVSGADVAPPPGARAADADAGASPEPGYEMSSEEIAVQLARVAWETKAEDVVALYVADQLSWCSYMVMVTIFSRPQLNAVLAKLEKEVRRIGRKAIVRPRGRSAWEVLDLGDVVVQVFSAETREYYNLEDLYGGAPYVELPFLEDADDSIAQASLVQSDA